MLFTYPRKELIVVLTIILNGEIDGVYFCGCWEKERKKKIGFIRIGPESIDLA